MSTLSILRHTLKLNASVVNDQQNIVAFLKEEIKAWKRAGETAYSADAEGDLRKEKAKLAKLVDMQKRVKVEIAAIFRNERIKTLYAYVFGNQPEQQQYTSYEQEKMLMALAAERRAALRADKKATGVVKST